MTLEMTFPSFFALSSIRATSASGLAERLGVLVAFIRNDTLVSHVTQLVYRNLSHTSHICVTNLRMKAGGKAFRC